MKTQARAVVIGGGVGGCSTLYHLTRSWLADVVLVERDELTSGSTWHAAGQVTQFGTGQTMVGLKRYSTRLYAELAADPDIRSTTTSPAGSAWPTRQDDIDGYQHFVAMAKGDGRRVRAALGRGERPAPSADRHRGPGRRALGPARRRHRPEPADPGPGPPGAPGGAEIYRFNPVDGDRAQTLGRLAGADREGRHRSARSWSTPPATGSTRSAPCWASSTRWSPWSTSTS